jgi:hypothetical protein
LGAIETFAHGERAIVAIDDVGYVSGVVFGDGYKAVAEVIEGGDKLVERDGSVVIREPDGFTIQGIECAGEALFLALIDLSLC